jgi:hypothetical protein
MKATKLLLAATFFAGLATLSIAGPGPQYWAQQGKNKETPAQAQVQPKADAPAQACTHCCGCADMKKV